MIAGGGPSGENHFGCAPQQWTAPTRLACRRNPNTGSLVGCVPTAGVMLKKSSNMIYPTKMDFANGRSCKWNFANGPYSSFIHIIISHLYKFQGFMVVFGNLEVFHVRPMLPG